MNCPLNIVKLIIDFKDKTMKKLSILALFVGLIGCASTDYSKVERSSATVTNLEFKEFKILKKRTHKIDVTFDYDIHNYQDISGLYHCSVQFNLNNGMTVTSHKGYKFPCSLDQATGHVSIEWPSPIDKSLNTSKETLSKLKYPVEFFVAIHQQTTKRKNIIIGQSKMKVSEI